MLKVNRTGNGFTGFIRLLGLAAKPVINPIASSSLVGDTDRVLVVQNHKQLSLGWRYASIERAPEAIREIRQM